MLTIDMKFSITPQQIDLGLEKVEVVTEHVIELENDHSKLINRDLPDQHPIGAISGLQDSLSTLNASVGGSEASIAEINSDIEEITVTLEKKIEGEAMTNADIADIWNNVMTS